MQFAAGGSEVNAEDGEIRPSSSRVKKVLLWNDTTRRFEMTDEDKRDFSAIIE